ncbi:redoxin family protein [soil metagenome]
MITFLTKAAPTTLYAAILLGAAPFAQAETPKVGQKAPDFKLPLLGKGETRLSKLTRKGPVVLVVLRGFPGYQCPFCTRQVGDFMANSADFEKAKAQVLFIYPGPGTDLQKHADEFVKGQTMPIGFSFSLDPDYKFTNLYDLRWDAQAETAYPCTFIIGRDGKVKFAKISHEHGDRISAKDVVKQLSMAM